MMTDTAWPRRPPLWTTLAILASLVLGWLYCLATLRFGGDRHQAELFPVYLKSSLWTFLPDLPHPGRAYRGHKFTMPDGSTMTVPPRLLEQQLRIGVYHGRSVPQLFRTSGICFLATFVPLLVLGRVGDRVYDRRSRDGRRLRGPRLVSRFHYNLHTWGDGLRFRLTTRRNLLECLRGTRGWDLVIRKSKESQHIQISGDTGSGKSTLIRTILYQVEERGETAIVFDPDREFLSEFYNGFRGDIVLNPKDERCPDWRIGEEVNDEADATAIAEGFFPDHPTAQQFFLDHTRAIFAYLLAYYKPTVNELGYWMAHPEEIDTRVAGTEHAHTLTENAAPQRAGVLGSLNNIGKPLRMMPSPNEGRQLFTIRGWNRKRQGWIFITSTPDTKDALLPLQSAWLDMLILKLQGEGADKNARRCWLVLDEVQILQKLPQLPTALTKQRKSGNPIVLGFQGMSQIDAAYGKQAEAMLSQAFNNFILRVKEPRAAEHLEKLIGKVQIERLRETRPSNILTNFRNRSFATERVVEPLVMASEIQALEDLNGYFLQAGRVVKIRFTYKVPPRRVVAPGLIERMIPPVQHRPLNPQQVCQSGDNQ